jgi:hypothetical protein
MLPGQLQDQLTDLLRSRRAPGGVRVGPLVFNRRRCQPSRVPGVTIRCNPRCLGSSRVKAAVTARSAQSGFGRATRRRRTATSCRRTTIPTSLETSLSPCSASQPNTRARGQVGDLADGWDSVRWIPDRAAPWWNGCSVACRWRSASGMEAQERKGPHLRGHQRHAAGCGVQPSAPACPPAAERRTRPDPGSTRRG